MEKLRSRDSEEHEYVACLLVTGPPAYLAARTDESHPTSTIGYKNKCAEWYQINIHSQVSRRMFYVIDMTGKFDKWYARYKAWLMENRGHG